jgi:hypothetical protein
VEITPFSPPLIAEEENKEEAEGGGEEAEGRRRMIATRIISDNSGTLLNYGIRVYLFPIHNSYFPLPIQKLRHSSIRTRHNVNKTRYS